MSHKLFRTFIAVDLSNAVRNTALNLQSTVNAQPGNVKWVKLQNIHLTLRFIGPTPKGEFGKINDILKNAVANHNDINLSIANTGVFPKPARPRILWLGVTGELEQLRNLVDEINLGLEKLGFPKEEREYSPHITIGRIRYPLKITPDVTDFIHSEFEPIPLQVQSVKFIESNLVPGGPVYSILGVHQLRPL